MIQTAIPLKTPMDWMSFAGALKVGVDNLCSYAVSEGLKPDPTMKFQMEIRNAGSYDFRPVLVCSILSGVG